jgi:alanine dehydrogenase
MSEVAGRMATQEGAVFLEKPKGGRGMLLGGIPGVQPAKVLILGGGIVGVNAAKIAAGMGADTTIMDINMPRLRYLDDVMPENIHTFFSTEANIRSLLPSVDLIIGAVLKPGAKAPNLITRDMLKEMRPGTVLVDVAIDQGGCFETSKVTTHSNPTFDAHGVTHYCVPNIPSRYARTASVSISNIFTPYLLDIAEEGGFENAARFDQSLRKGMYFYHGILTSKTVADWFNLPFRDINLLII